MRIRLCKRNKTRRAALRPPLPDRMTLIPALTSTPLVSSPQTLRSGYHLHLLPHSREFGSSPPPSWMVRLCNIWDLARVLLAPRAFPSLYVLSFPSTTGQDWLCESGSGQSGILDCHAQAARDHR